MRGHHLRAGLISFKYGCLLVHCLLTVIYFINVPLIEMAAREKRGKSDWKWLHVIDAHHRGEEEIPHEIRRRRVIWVDQRHSCRLFNIQWNMFRDPEMSYFYIDPKCHTFEIVCILEVGWHCCLVLQTRMLWRVLKLCLLHLLIWAFFHDFYTYK